MARRLFATFATLLSLLGCAAACVLWARSGSVYDRALWTHYRRDADGGATARSLELDSRRGRLWVTWGWGQIGRPGDLYWDEYYRRADATRGRARLEFGHDRPHPADTMFALNVGPDAGTTGWGPVRWQRWGQSIPPVPVVQQNLRVGLPHWLLAMPLAILPAWVIGRRLTRHRRRRARLARGLCPACGYDLCASAGRCPECGAAGASYRTH